MNAMDAMHYSIKMIENAVIKTEPYKHLVIDGIFPADFYMEMLLNFPDEEEMPKSRDDVRQLDLVVDPGVERFAEGKLLIDNNLKHSNTHKFDFWDKFRAAYFSNEFCEVFLKKFDGDIDDRDRKEYYPVGRITCDLKGAGLGPHRDRDDKICSILFYMGDSFDPAVAEPFGTITLKPNNVIDIGDTHLDYSNFTVAEVIKYYPNRMACWAVSRGEAPNESFHAYHQTLDASRKLIKYFIQRDDDVDEVRSRINSTRHNTDKWRHDV